MKENWNWRSRPAPPAFPAGTPVLVVNGAGSAGIACIELLKAFGMRHDNVILCDTRGVIYQGREQGMNQWKSAHAADTKTRTLEEAMKGADVFFGLSAEGAVTHRIRALEQGITTRWVLAWRWRERERERERTDDGTTR